MSRTYGKLWRTKHGGQWVLDADPHVHLRAKRIFGQLSSRQVDVLVLSHTPEVCRELEWFCQRYPMVVSPADAAVLASSAAAHRDTIAALDTIIDPSYVPQTFDLAVPARSYQAREAELYLRAGGLLIADDVGLGKTAAAICSLTDPRTLPAVVVTLAHLPRQWERELAKFAPALRVHRIRRGRPYELPLWFGRGPDVLLVNYHKLHGWAKVFAAYAQSIIFDEIQELRHRDSQKYSAARAIASAVPFRLGLSATPIYNYGGEVYNVLNLLRPGSLGTSTEFATEWCTHAAAGEKAKLKQPKAFGAWAREQFLIVRHTRAQVGRELPAVSRIPHTIDTDQAALLSVKASAAELARLILQRTAEATKGQRWRAAEELSVLLRQATGIAKAGYVADFVRMLVASGERVVLYGWHREVYRIWQSKLADLNPVLFTGTESPTQKQASITAFLEGKANPLIMSLRSGAGIDGLQQVSSCVVFGELDWSPGVHEQAIGRVHRDGQSTPVLAYFLVAEDGADPVIAEMLGLKREQVEGIRNPDQDVLERLETDPSHARRLAEAYLRQLGERLPEPEEVSA